MELVSNIIFSESFWLPHYVKWKDFENVTKIDMPVAWHCFLALPIAVGLFILRLLFERFISTPIGRIFKLKESRPKKPRDNELLENEFRSAFKKTIPNYESLLELSKKTDLTVRQLERWWRRRRIFGNPSEMQKFNEASWRLTFYCLVFWYGLIILFDKDYFWDTRNCWSNYPYQHLSKSIWWYYQIEMAFYWSLLISVFMDTKRKDFAINLCHHFATLSLMIFSFIPNFIRMGSLVLCVHDAVDGWLESAKLAKYLKFSKLTDVLFIIFASVWVITRLCIFPFYLIRSTLFESEAVMQGKYVPAHVLFNILLITLLILHIYWFYLICRMLHKYLISGEIEKDIRSETEPDTSDNEVRKQNGNGISRQ
ncbi:DgyrCDS10153 [Dimorphilus gyrociliatus]|uniref:DgyrCDS10153 n=1 Tax=Dimorphilus gyrociliatus TaxID=2664684 RepID=A0A7I8W0I2_9ANNE|nr:DgyrCDS10153 [Dimorphilus gyrociliatus]